MDHQSDGKYEDLDQIEPNDQTPSLDRHDTGTARLVIERLYPDADVRRRCLDRLAESIRTAHTVSTSSWSLTLHEDSIRLNVGSLETLHLDRGGVLLILDRDAISSEEWRRVEELELRPKWGGRPHKTLTSAYGFHVPIGRLDEVLPTLWPAHLALVQAAARKVRTRTQYHYTHSPSVVDYLRSELGQDVPSPQFGEGPVRPGPIDTSGMILEVFRRAGLHFTPWQIAAFYTALQTKGFVILSGISGTGKSKLAQQFASMLPRPIAASVSSADRLVITVQPYMTKYRRIVLPTRAHQFFDLPDTGDVWDVEVRAGKGSAICRLSAQQTIEGTYSGRQLLLKNPVARWFADSLTVGDRFVIEPVNDENGRPQSLQIAREDDRSALPAGPGRLGRNVMFLSVRPDWRDSKSLMGYYNPLTEDYEWTDFLRFTLQAVRSYRAGDGQAWFIILDEMNLAHVEYYFADLLSVIESGRDSDGWTREPLRLTFPEDAQGDLPPAEIPLPPNLYVVGTVNIDETTHAFSPKVLDRAFSLELSSVDFRDYPPTPTAAPPLSPDESAALLRAFTDDGRFPRIDKAVVARCVADHPQVRRWLQALNEQLAPHNMHFGYRVFDEIVCFLDHAERNGMFAGLSQDEYGEWPAFDAAVLMKVLPKFHGSRGKLEAPLRAILGWCLDPEIPALTALDVEAQQRGPAASPSAELGSLPYRFPRTAARSIRMLDDLYQDGFTAFG